MQKLAELSKKLNITFRNNDLIREAFVHRSYLNEAKTKISSNERLEFLGDSILSFLVSSYLFKHYPQFSEGELTNLRSAVVKTSTLATISQKLKLGELLLLSHGEEEGGGRKNVSILADTFEALIGALFLDQGLETVKKILEKLLFPLFEEILKSKAYKDAKSIFQEVVQEEVRISPVYKVIKEKGPDHAKEFTVGVYVGNTLWGTGVGKNKQEGEMQAAKAALEKWRQK